MASPVGRTYPQGAGAGLRIVKGHRGRPRHGVENEEAKGVVVDATGEVKEAVGTGTECGGSGR